MYTIDYFKKDFSSNINRDISLVNAFKTLFAESFYDEYLDTNELLSTIKPEMSQYIITSTLETFVDGYEGDFEKYVEEVKKQISIEVDSDSYEELLSFHNSKKDVLRIVIDKIYKEQPNLPLNIYDSIIDIIVTHIQANPEVIVDFVKIQEEYKDREETRDLETYYWTKQLILEIGNQKKLNIEHYQLVIAKAKLRYHIASIAKIDSLTNEETNPLDLDQNTIEKGIYLHNLKEGEIKLLKFKKLAISYSIKNEILNQRQLVLQLQYALSNIIREDIKAKILSDISFNMKLFKKQFLNRLSIYDNHINKQIEIIRDELRKAESEIIDSDFITNSHSELIEFYLTDHITYKHIIGYNANPNYSDLWFELRALDWVKDTLQASVCKEKITYLMKLTDSFSSLEEPVDKPVAQPSQENKQTQKKIDFETIFKDEKSKSLVLNTIEDLGYTKNFIWCSSPPSALRAFVDYFISTGDIKRYSEGQICIIIASRLELDIKRIPRKDLQIYDDVLAELKTYFK